MAAVPAQSLPVAAPSFVMTLVHDYAQKALTLAAAALAAHGATMADSQRDQFIQLGVSAALFLFSCAWTYVAAKVRTARLNAAIAAPAGMAAPPVTMDPIPNPVPANQGVAK